MMRIHTSGSTVLLVGLLGACNRAPGPAVLLLTPEAPLTGDNLELTIRSEAPDSDGDAITYSYRWYRDGEEMPELTESYVDSSETSKGEEWTVSVTPYDGKVFGPPTSMSTTIGNTPPKIVSLSLNPPAPTYADSVLAVIETEDVDGDDVILDTQWLRNGNDIEIDGLEIMADQTSIGDVWTLLAVPQDDETAGEGQSVSVSIITNFEGWSNDKVPITTADFSFTTPDYDCSFIPKCKEFNQIGHTVAAGDDVDGDGLRDLLVGTGGDGSEEGSDKAYLILGADIRSSSEDEMLLGDARVTFQMPDAGGWSVAGPGDLDGDGLAEVLLTGPNRRVENYTEWWDDSDQDRAYLIFGDQLTSHSGPYQVEGAGTEFYYGGEAFYGQPAGDVNGGSQNDLFFSLHTEHLNYTGEENRVKLLFGENLSSEPGEVDLLSDWDVEFVSDPFSAYDKLAADFLIAGQGDLDGDGFDDIAIGLDIRSQADLMTIHYGSGIPTEKSTINVFDAEHLLVLTEEIASSPHNPDSGQIRMDGDIDGDGLSDLLFAVGANEILNESTGYFETWDSSYAQLTDIAGVLTGDSLSRMDDSPTRMKCEWCFVGNFDTDKAYLPGLHGALFVGDMDYDERSEVMLGAASYDEFEEQETGLFLSSDTPEAGTYRFNYNQVSYWFESDPSSRLVLPRRSIGDINQDGKEDLLFGVRLFPVEENIWANKVSLFYTP